MFKRGRYPNWIACRVMEKAPLMTACEAMMVARVANNTVGTIAQAGTIA